MNDRVLRTELESLLDETETLLLFVRADKIVPVRRMTDFAAWMREAGEELTGEPTPEEMRDTWTIELAPTQARMADVIQEVMAIKEDSGLRLGIVISAWDKRTNDSESPLDWARRELAIVVQLLESSAIDWTVFGVSAQGGDFDNNADRERLEKIDLAERAYAHDADRGTAGIGAPLRWALEV